MYKKVTNAQPPIGEEVLVYNGKYEIKNTWDGEQWEFGMKYPITHWTEKPKLPSIEEVKKVRKQL